MEAARQVETVANVKRAYQREIERLSDELEDTPTTCKNINVYGTDLVLIEKVLAASAKLSKITITKCKSSVLAMCSDTRGKGKGREKSKSKSRTKQVVSLVVQSPQDLHGSSSTSATRRTMYRLLELQRKDLLSVVFIFPSLSSVDAIEKRVRSRMSSIHVYIRRIQPEDLADRSLETLHKYSINNNYHTLYSHTYNTKYKMLNSIHLLLLILSSFKRLTVQTVYEEFSKITANVKSLKKTTKSTVLRRYYDLLETESIVSGSFIGSLSEVEQEVLERQDVILQVILQKHKKYFNS